MNNTRWQAQVGMVLIEAMVALVVLAAGILGVAKLNAFFIEVSGQAKARTQAVQLAESRLEELRTLMVRDPQFTGITALAQNSAETIYGFSASGVQSTQFQRWWTVTNNGTDGRNIEVFVSWTDRGNTNQQVAVRSVVTWDDPGKSVALAIGGPGAAGTYASAPTGRAVIPNNKTVTIPSGTPAQDGLYRFKVDDKYVLTDAAGKVLLEATADDEDFSEIAGNVYIDQASLGQGTLSSGKYNGLSNDDVFVVISDASFCSMSPAKAASPENALTSLGSGTVFKFFSYRCFVGANWYGNIGVVRTDNANTNDRVCVGDPAVTAVAGNVKSDNRHPALSTIRMYRGYTGTSPSYQSTGIGVQSGGYTAAEYDGHDFLLTRITGNPNDADCSAKLRLFDISAPYEPFSTDAQTHAPTTETAFLNGGNTVILGNPGKFFCFTTTCPEDVSLEPPTPVTIHITGTVTLSPGSGSNKPTLASMNTNSGPCVISGGNGSNPYTYDCEFTGAGFTGGTWSGFMVVTTGSSQYVCHTGIGGTSTLLSAAPASPVQNTYTFNFNNQSVDAGSSTLNFKIGKLATDC